MIQQGPSSAGLNTRMAPGRAFHPGTVVVEIENSARQDSLLKQVCIERQGEPLGRPRPPTHFPDAVS